MKGRGRMLIWLGGLAAGALFIGLASIWGPVRSDSSDVLKTAEKLSATALQEYASGSFGGATNALLAEVNYLNGHRDTLLPFLRVDMMLRTSYARLAMLFLHLGDVDRANHYLSECHRLFIGDKEGHPAQAMSRGEFVDFIIEWMSTIDRKTGARWKDDIRLDPAAVEELRSRSSKQDEAGLSPLRLFNQTLVSLFLPTASSKR
jgi:hypothetical protein